jgi:Holliday junction resolvasome RuvABC endonuclease subunit
VIVLGIDPGLASVGFAVVESRKVLASRCVRTDQSWDTHRRIGSILDELEELVGEHDPALLAVEDYAYYGEASNTRNAMLLPRVIGAIEGWAHCRVQMVTMRRIDVLSRLGLKGVCDKSRAARWCAQVLTGERPTNEHARDAAMVAVAAGIGYRVSRK